MRQGNSTRRILDSCGNQPRQTETIDKSVIGENDDYHVLCREDCQLGAEPDPPNRDQCRAVNLHSTPRAVAAAQSMDSYGFVLPWSGMNATIPTGCSAQRYSTT